MPYAITFTLFWLLAGAAAGVFTGIRKARAPQGGKPFTTTHQVLGGALGVLVSSLVFHQYYEGIAGTLPLVLAWVPTETWLKSYCLNTAR